MNLFTIIAALGVGYLIVNRNGSTAALFGNTSITGGAANQAQQQAQLRALASAVQKGQSGTASQIATLQQALQKLAHQSQQQGKGGGASGSGSPSGGGGSSIGTQKGSQTYDPIAQLFLASNLNSQQSIAAESVLKSGGTLDDAALAAGVDVQQIIGAISPQIEAIIQETAPSEVITNTDFGGFNPIETSGYVAGPDTQQDASFNSIPGVDGTYSSFDQIAPTPFIDSGTSDYTAGYDGLVQIDPIPYIDPNSIDTSNSFAGQDPYTDPSFYQNNSMIDGSFTPSTTDLSTGLNPIDYSDWTSADWNTGGYAMTTDNFNGGTSGFDAGWSSIDSVDL